MSRSTHRFAVFALGMLSAAAHAQGLPPNVAAKKMTAVDGFRVSLFASEPDVRQPILVKVDDRGRLWTIQYLQYPNPAGLKRVSVDRWSRTVYDRIPKPPPHGPRGADRITIMQDTDGDGRADTFRDFVDGLNLCTGLEFGYRGVFVLQVPFLLFYPDRNRDDVPDRDPDVLLRGFGMEDAQSLANHLTWGPDGWLYGVNGSTTTCRIRGIEFQQGVWRYHPPTDRFELFCEGGGNTYGLTFDALGNLFYSTNGGPFVHAVQGAYFRKSFGKHGPLHNLYTYGFLEYVTGDRVPGGPPTGGTIYSHPNGPAVLQHQFVSGNFLGQSASWWSVHRDRSTFRAKFVGQVLNAHDTWFGATDVCQGPDGSLYVCDFHDQRTSHPDPDAKWDRSNGRIYQLRPDGSDTQAIDVRQMSVVRLVDQAIRGDLWTVNRARAELASRHAEANLDLEAATAAIRLVEGTDRVTTLRRLWIHETLQTCDDELLLTSLKHPDAAVRRWAVRIAGNRRGIRNAIAAALTQIARTEQDAAVRCQLAATARRLDGRACLDIVEVLVEADRPEDRGDPRIPLMIWWALESKAMTDYDRIASFVNMRRFWKVDGQYSLLRDMTRHLIRRWAAEGQGESYDLCRRVLQRVPLKHRTSLLLSLNQGLAERSEGFTGIGQGGLFAAYAAEPSAPTSKPRRYAPIRGQLRTLIADEWQAAPTDRVRTELALRAEVNGVYAALLKRLPQDDGSEQQLADLTILREFAREDAVSVVLPIFVESSFEGHAMAGLDILRRFEAPEIHAALLRKYFHLAGFRLSPTSPLRSRIRAVLLSRPKSADAFLRLVDAGRIPAKDIPVNDLRVVASHKDPRLDAMVVKHWGRIQRGTTEQRLAMMRKYQNDLRPGGGHADRGAVLFKKKCATCHRLFGQGEQIGPDLTSTNRKDRASLLANLVDPSAVVRRDYMSHVVVTDSGQVLTGLIAEQDGASLTLVDAKVMRHKLRKTEIESVTPSTVSLMPERLLDDLTPAQVRDLFAYLASDPPPTNDTGDSGG